MRPLAPSLLAAAAALLLPLPAAAGTGLYSFTDEQGVRHFTNMPSDPRYQPVPASEPPRAGGDARSRPYEEAIVTVAQRHGVDANLLRAVIKCESDFNHFAVSRAGAQGLMQLMPETARLVNVDNPFDVEQNLDGGTRHLRRLLDVYRDDKTLALAAYNAGEGAVRRHGGVPPFQETRKYVAAVLEQYERYCTLGTGGDVITSADIHSFVNSEGVRLLTNVPWRYGKDGDWRKLEEQ